MSEKKPGRGRGRGYRPNVSETVPFPAQEVVENLLKDVPVVDSSADGMVGVVCYTSQKCFSDRC